MEDFITGLFIAGGVAAVILIIYHIAKALRKEPHKHATARVTRTFTEVSTVGRRQAVRLCAEFQLRNGDRITFTVGRKVFTGINEGDKGELVYRGGKFIKFYKNRI